MLTERNDCQCQCPSLFAEIAAFYDENGILIYRDKVCHDRSSQAANW
jgi:hypothetical protein